jgi:hypothetical protein
MVAAYARGATPNPDLGCNRLVKFGAFWAHARAAGCVAMATGTGQPPPVCAEVGDKGQAHVHRAGHYAQVGVDDDGEEGVGVGTRYLLRGASAGVRQGWGVQAFAC